MGRDSNPWPAEYGRFRPNREMTSIHAYDDAMSFHRVSATSVDFRHTFVEESLSNLRSIYLQQSLLDVGAGQQRYKSFAEELGYEYSSHDFSGHHPDPSRYSGLQDKNWIYPEQDFTCDILEIPESRLFDLVLCTEVLEHVPDPAAAFRKLAQLTALNGYIVLTVPLSSLIHQAPDYFASGLSPYFFHYWCGKLDLSVEKLDLSGNYTDMINIELHRLFSPFWLGKPLIILNEIAIRLVRNRISPQIQSASGFNTLLVAKKIG